MFTPQQIRSGAISIASGVLIPVIAAFYFGIDAFWIALIACLAILLLFSDGVRTKTQKWSEQLEAWGKRHHVPSLIIVFIVGICIVSSAWIFGMWRVKRATAQSAVTSDPNYERIMAEARTALWQARTNREKTVASGGDTHTNVPKKINSHGIVPPPLKKYAGSHKDIVQESFGNNSPNIVGDNAQVNYNNLHKSQVLSDNDVAKLWAF